MTAEQTKRIEEALKGKIVFTPLKSKNTIKSKMRQVSSYKGQDTFPFDSILSSPDMYIDIEEVLIDGTSDPEELFRINVINYILIEGIAKLFLGRQFNQRTAKVLYEGLEKRFERAEAISLGLCTMIAIDMIIFKGNEKKARKHYDNYSPDFILNKYKHPIRKSTIYQDVRRILKEKNNG